MQPPTDRRQALGAVEAEYGPSKTNLTAGNLVAVLLIGAGAGLVYLMFRNIQRVEGQLPLIAGHGLSWFGAAVGMALGGCLLWGGASLYRRVASLKLLEVFVCPGGFYYRNGETSEAFPWTEIVVVEELMLHQRSPPAAGPALPAFSRKTTSRLLVRRQDGEEIRFDASSIDDIAALEELLRQQCQQHGIRWEIVEQHFEKRESDDEPPNSA